MTEFHICPGCWPKLVAWFEGQRARPKGFENGCVPPDYDTLLELGERIYECLRGRVH